MKGSFLGSLMLPALIAAGAARAGAVDELLAASADRERNPE